VGQAGGESQWQSGKYNLMKGHAEIVFKKFTANYSAFMCDLGAIYELKDSRLVIYLPAGAVVVADKINIPENKERSMIFRLLTGGENSMELTNNGFIFKMGNVNAAIVDYSPSVNKKTIEKKAQVSSYSGRKFRDVANMKVDNKSSALFAVVIGVDGSEKNVSLKVTDEKIIITGIAGEQKDLIVNWDGYIEK
jgi:hypothetical protein